MLTSPSTRPSAHLDFLPDSSQGASSSSVAVSTRLISGYVSPNAPRRQPISSTLDNPAQAIVPSKRKSSASASLPSKMQTLDARPKLKRGSSSDRSRGSSRQHSPAPLQQPIYRFNKSRSPSAFQISESRIPRLHWIEEDGTPGDRFLSCESVVHTLMHSYKSYFKNPKDPNDTSFEPHPTAYPTSELEYPNTGGCETFILLAPKDVDHYNPIMCLERSLYTIIENYLTPAQQSLFGSLPTDRPVENILSPLQQPSPTKSPPNLRNSNASSTSSLTSLSSSTSSLTSLSSSTSSLSSLSSAYSTSPSPRINYLRVVQRAINRHDGPLFQRTMIIINSILRTLKYPALPPDPFSPTPLNILKEAVRSWTSTGIPQKVIMRIIDETYQRSVGPHVESLKNYEAFSSSVYGELMPHFISDIIAETCLNQNSFFIDLGSGVGNVVIQASLQSGCKSYGIELMPSPAKVARNQLEQVKVRCRMWGVSLGDVELEEGDMLNSQRLTELIPKADVILVNNKVFLQSLNEALRTRFLDLKEGAIVVSLKPFVSSLNARVTERNVDDMSAIFDVIERQYRSGSVSWGSSSGPYYIHRVDRKGYADIKARFESMRAESSRSSRSRRSGI